MMRLPLCLLFILTSNVQAKFCWSKNGKDVEDYDKIITCYEYGANACIKKPDDITAFSTVIRAITNFWLEINVLPSFKAAVI